MTLYETDYYQWVLDQTQALQEHKFEKLDVEHLIEEVVSLGISQKHALESYLARLIAHLLKQEVQPENDCKSWRSSILHSKQEIALILKRVPSLKRIVPEAVVKAYEQGAVWASEETGIDYSKFPKACPWTIEELLK